MALFLDHQEKREILVRTVTRVIQVHQVNPVNKVFVVQQVPMDHREYRVSKAHLVMTEKLAYPVYVECPGDQDYLGIKDAKEMRDLKVKKACQVKEAQTGQLAHRENQVQHLAQKELLDLQGLMAKTVNPVSMVRTENRVHQDLPVHLDCRVIPVRMELQDETASKERRDRKVPQELQEKPGDRARLENQAYLGIQVDLGKQEKWANQDVLGNPDKLENLVRPEILDLVHRVKWVGREKLVHLDLMVNQVNQEEHYPKVPEV